ncbi:hypothetical protein SAMN05660297_02399 [Natronincola peptidivorans]|uniref:DUF6487 domain-containing protein n=1 Tax=Natronincola peptidivorans TaxID=426128 RepID=A0A1I0EDR4_9FIRM|nr:PF20097 family protein [Natronincola peptidivorans]SET43114.1 hypothetical protein SAMN05660297_02399 [Natronincola peptidivorans]
MHCPYCNEEMRIGVIHGDRYAIKWVPKDKDRGGLLQWFSKGIILAGFSESVEDVFYCDKCEKIIIDTKGKKDTRKK